MAFSWHGYAFLTLMSVLGGMVNSIAGGGTLLTFPALLALISPVSANATSTLALVPGSVAAGWGYRKELFRVRRWTLLLVGPCFFGGVVGSLLLVKLPARYFEALIPWLILMAACLFSIQPFLTRWLRGRGTSGISVQPIAIGAFLVFQFLVAVYGGYFGAGLGILILGALGLMGFADIHEMNALKACMGAVINGVSAVIFVVKGQVDWRFGPCMAIAAIAGGYVGARVSRRLNRDLVRWIVVAIGFVLAAHFFLR